MAAVDTSKYYTDAEPVATIDNPSKSANQDKYWLDADPVQGIYPVSSGVSGFSMLLLLEDY